MSHRNCTARSRQNSQKLSTKAKIKTTHELPVKAPVKHSTPNVPAKVYAEDPVLDYPTGPDCSNGMFGYLKSQGARRSLNQRQKRKLKRQR
jgi:hypothetical protein